MARGISARTLAKLIARGQTQEHREQVKAERATVASVKQDRRARLQAIAEQCRALRASHTTDAKRQREELRAAIDTARAVIKDKCKAARGDEATAQRLIDAIEELSEVRDRLRVHLAGIKLPPKDAGRVRGGMRTAELKQEMIDEVASDIEVHAPELEPVWRNMARRMPARYRASKHRSALEGFTEWAAENAGEVAEIQDRLLGRSVQELEAREEEEQRDIYEAGEAKRLRDHRRLVKVTAASARKLDSEAALDRYEAVSHAMHQEGDADRAAALRRASDVLHGDLIRRGLFDAPGVEAGKAAGMVPF